LQERVIGHQKIEWNNNNLSLLITWELDKNFSPEKNRESLPVKDQKGLEAGRLAHYSLHIESQIKQMPVNSRGDIPTTMIHYFPAVLLATDEALLYSQIKDLAKNYLASTIWRYWSSCLK